LNAFGYMANAQQSAAALQGIRLLISVIPAVAAAGLILVFRYYIIDEALLQRIHAELAERQRQ
jgi:GPH family glycoside/pentoside/hexuronide:cation symporter